MKISVSWIKLVKLCQELADQATKWGDIPVGALVVRPRNKKNHNNFSLLPKFPYETKLDSEWLFNRLTSSNYVSLWEDWELLGIGANQREIFPYDPTAHAEVLALRQATANVNRWRLSECSLVVSLEPCLMCAGAALAARIKRVVFGAWDPKAGAAGSMRDVLRDCRLNHQTEVLGGLLEAECSEQLIQFFQKHR